MGDPVSIALPDNKPLLVGVGGVHGAGKSTFCREVLKHLQISYVTPQEMVKELEETGGSIDRSELIRRLKLRVDELIGQRQSFCFEHVMSGNYVGKLIERAIQQDYHIHLVYLEIGSVELAIRRVEKRVTQGGHEVDRSLIGDRLSQSRQNFSHYREQADSWQIFRNDGACRVLAEEGRGKI